MKLLSIIPILTLSFTLASCGGGNNEIKNSERQDIQNVYETNDQSVNQDSSSFEEVPTFQTNKIKGQLKITYFNDRGDFKTKIFALSDRGNSVQKSFYTSFYNNENQLSSDLKIKKLLNVERVYLENDLDLFKLNKFLKQVNEGNFRISNGSVSLTIYQNESQNDEFSDLSFALIDSISLDTAEDITGQIDFDYSGKIWKVNFNTMFNNKLIEKIASDNPIKFKLLKANYKNENLIELYKKIDFKKHKMLVVSNSKKARFYKYNKDIAVENILTKIDENFTLDFEGKVANLWEKESSSHIIKSFSQYKGESLSTWEYLDAETVVMLGYLNTQTYIESNQLVHNKIYPVDFSDNKIEITPEIDWNSVILNSKVSKYVFDGYTDKKWVNATYHVPRETEPREKLRGTREQKTKCEAVYLRHREKRVDFDFTKSPLRILSASMGGHAVAITTKLVNLNNDLGHTSLSLESRRLNDNHVRIGFQGYGHCPDQNQSGFRMDHHDTSFHHVLKTDRYQVSGQALFKHLR